MILIKVSTDSTVEPLTVGEVKDWLRIETTADDVIIQSLIKTVRKQAEKETQRCIVPATFKLILEDFPSATGVIEIPRPPLSSVSTVTVEYIKDTTIANDTTQVESSAYTVDFEKTPARIYPIYDNEWPSCVTTEKKDAVQITFNAGYTTESEMPIDIKLWMKMKIGAYYENREAVFESRSAHGTYHMHSWDMFDGLLDEYRIIYP